MITTGTVFGLIVVMHIWRVFADGPPMATNIWFVLITLLAAGLSVWAWRLVLTMRRSG